MHGEPFTEHKSTFQVSDACQFCVIGVTFKALAEPCHVITLPPTLVSKKRNGKRTAYMCYMLQAHLAPATSAEDVERCMNTLLQHNKIRNATHNILAYRIYVENKDAWLQVCIHIVICICQKAINTMQPCLWSNACMPCLALFAAKVSFARQYQSYSCLPEMFRGIIAHKECGPKVS